jgi:hypothetical protein
MIFEFLLCVCVVRMREGEREREEKKKHAEKSSLRNVRGSWHNESYTMSQQSIMTYLEICHELLRR